METGSENFGKPVNYKDAYFNPSPDLKRLLNRADDFAAAMKQKLRQKYAEGKTGWDDPAWPIGDVIAQLEAHIEKGDMVDVANFALFAWHKSA